MRTALAFFLTVGLLACGEGNPTPEPTPLENPIGDSPLNLEVIPASSLPPAGGETLKIRAQQGVWLAPQPWPVIAIHAALMAPTPQSDNRSSIVTWGWNSDTDIAGGVSGNLGKTTVDRFTPASGTHESTVVNSGTNGDMFGNGHAFDANGNLFTAGGAGGLQAGQWIGIKDTLELDGQSGQWRALPQMHLERWYPTVTLLPSGEMLSISGTPLQDLKPNQRLSEVFNGTWRTLDNAQDRALAYYPWMHVMPDGRVFNSGPQQQMAILDTSGSGQWTSVTTPRDSVNRGYGSSSMFAQNKVLVVGGATGNKTATVVDIRTGQAQATGALETGRRNLNALVLPDGSVLAVGGNTGFGNSDGEPAYAAERWDPKTGAWSTLASQHEVRNYHSTALLLPSGAVISMGGFNTTGMKTAEVFLPPYLFDQNGQYLETQQRPQAHTAQTEIAYGQSFELLVKSSKAIQSLALLSPGSTTHAFDMSQRRSELDFKVIAKDKFGSSQLRVQAPANANLFLPGKHMLFALDSDGVPSSAVWLKLH